MSKSNLTAMEVKILEAISREGGLKSVDADMVTTNSSSLKVHVCRLRDKGWDIVAVPQPRFPGRNGRAPCTYFLRGSLNV